MFIAIYSQTSKYIHGLLFTMYFIESPGHNRYFDLI